MASHSCSANPIHFFKIILKSNLQTLRIPLKFTDKYGGCLPNPVFLKPPDGKEWEVHWTKDHDNGFWFHKGWDDFSSFYSLDFGHLVVFKYEGTSQLDVNIFDQTALEIEYPFHDPSSVQNHNLNNKISDENVIEILDDDMPPNKKARPKTTLPSPRPHKKMRTSQDVENKSSNQQNLHVFQKSTNAELNCKHESEEDMEGEAFTENKGLNFESMKLKSLTGLEKMEALKRASTFRSENPFFKVVMQPSYVSGRCPLNVPKAFFTSVMKEKNNVMIEMGNRSWPVKIAPTAREFRFSSGWLSFARESKLQAGDICIFELIQKGNDEVLQVHVFRSPK